MILKLSTAALLVLVLLMHIPAQGQSAAPAHSATLSKASSGSMSASTLDLTEEMAIRTDGGRGFSAFALASKLIEVLASQNAITLNDVHGGTMDAYLRPPQVHSGDAGLFRQAKSMYDYATTIESARSEIKLDPFNLRCALRINLNQLFNN